MRGDDNKSTASGTGGLGGGRGGGGRGRGGGGGRGGGASKRTRAAVSDGEGDEADADEDIQQDLGRLLGMLAEDRTWQVDKQFNAMLSEMKSLKRATARRRLSRSRGRVKNDASLFQLDDFINQLDLALNLSLAATNKKMDVDDLKNALDEAKPVIKAGTKYGSGSALRRPALPRSLARHGWLRSEKSGSAAISCRGRA